MYLEMEKNCLFHYNYAVSYQYRKVEDTNARYDEIHDVEQGLPPNFQVEKYVWGKAGEKIGWTRL